MIEYQVVIFLTFVLVCGDKKMGTLLSLLVH